MTDQKNDAPLPLAPVSIGELVDKITILEIKESRIDDADKLANVANELRLLRKVLADTGVDPGDEADALRAVNGALWDIEDDIRDLEAVGDFGTQFIELARAVYKTNDKRAALKRAINDSCGSALVEEKSYSGM